MEKINDTIMAQYANGPFLVGYIERLNLAIDPTVDLDAFYDYVFNVDTAQGFGLDIWGRIVDVSRNIQIDTTVTYLGFDEARIGNQQDGPQPFGQAPFYTGQPLTQVYALGDDAYRKLILVKALANITDCTIPNLNALLQFVFEGEGRCYVLDTGGMTIRYVFEFTLSPVERSIMLRSGVIPRPAGVLAQVLTTDAPTTFGFNEAGGLPFGAGVFFTPTGFQDAI